MKYSHDVEAMNMKSHDLGEVVLPSEVDNIHFPGTLRQFMILSKRLTSIESLNKLQDLDSINVRQLSYIPPGLTPLNNSYPFIGLQLKVKPINNSVEQFKEEIGEDFFLFLINLFSNSVTTQHKGTRAVFIQNFNTIQTIEHGILLETKILLGTSIFYNDYRVTVNFPNSQEVLFDICKEFYFNILTHYPCIEIELNTYTLENDLIV